MLFIGVLRVICNLANHLGRYPSLAAPRTMRDAVKRELRARESSEGVVRVQSVLLPSGYAYLFKAPKQDMATMHANTMPPAGPKMAFPKSRPTVFE